MIVYIFALIIHHAKCILTYKSHPIESSNYYTLQSSAFDFVLINRHANRIFFLLHIIYVLSSSAGVFVIHSYTAKVLETTYLIRNVS
jgi:hypothetical protein